MVLLLPSWSYFLLCVGVLGLSLAIGIIAITSVGYLLVLSIAAYCAQRVGTIAVTNESDEHPRFTIVIPAHNEEAVLGATLHSLRAQEYPSHLFRVVVIADNCNDTTASLAHSHGADIVFERSDTSLRGKGYALEWAFAKLLDSENAELVTYKTDAFVIVDADTFAAPDLLKVFARHLTNQADKQAKSVREAEVALQGRYGVLNPEGGWRSALMTAAFDLCNHVKLLGASHLGWAVGLKGNGMVFTHAVLERAPWQGRSITEDIDFGLDLLLHHNLRAGYAPDARVWAQMPVGDKPAASQRERWERGRYRLLRDRTPQLLREGLRQRRLPLIVAGWDLAVPPLAEIVSMLALWGLLAVAAVVFLPGRAATLNISLWGFCTVGLLAYVLSGLKLAGANREAWTALWHVPVYVAWKLGLYVARFVLRPLRHSKQPASSSNASQTGDTDVDAWVRTERIALDVSTAKVPLGADKTAVPSAEKIGSA